MSVEIVYETHSISVDNERGVATGWVDGELSERGRESARALGTRPRDGGFAVVFGSDLGRAVETAELAFGDSGIPIVFDARLRECNYGAPVARIEAERSRRIDEPYPGGESYRDVVDRMRAFLDDVVSRYEGKRVLVISHAAPRWALEHVVAGTQLEELVDAPFEWREGWEYVVRGD